MRSSLLLICLTIAASAAPAQEQERKLIDRLLRPDTSLVNSAQGKKFVDAKQISTDKKVDTKAFESGARHPTKSFFGLREFFARRFESKKSSQNDLMVVTPNAGRYAAARFVTTKASPASIANDAGRKVKTQEYIESERPFLAKGTRQKFLSQENHSLTIDEVRALLNRSD